MHRIRAWLRAVGLALLGAIVIVACVVAFNVSRLKSQQLNVALVPRVPLDERAAAERLGAAVRFQTISSLEDPDHSPDALRGLQAHMLASFPSFHAVAKREVVGGYSLLYTWEGSDPKIAPIALLAHQDVVPVSRGTEKDWQSPPFGGEVRDGFVWGRGSWDDKASLYGILEAAEQLAKEGFRPTRTLYFAFGHDEEVRGLRGARALVALLASRGVRFELVLDEGLLIAQSGIRGLARPTAIVGVAEKGYATFALTAHAIPGHSSMPLHETAIGMMSAALARLDSNPMPAHVCDTVHDMFDALAPEMSGVNRVVLSNVWLFEPLLLRRSAKGGSTEASIRTTTALTIVDSGDKDNVLPGNAEATVNFRLLPGDTQASVLEHLRHTIANDKISIEPAAGNCEASLTTSTQTAGYRMLDRTIREIFPDVVVVPGLVLGSTDARYYADIADSVLRFAPMSVVPEETKGPHGNDERVSVSGYGDMIRFYRRLLQSSAGQ